MNESDIQEALVSLYLRLNGYFVTSFIAHADHGVTTEMDILAIRFPLHKEPEREVQPCHRLAIPNDRIDFVIGEVKGGQKNVKFNTAFRSNPDAIRTVLRRFGAFSDTEIERLTVAVPHLLEPATLASAITFPTVDVTLEREAGMQKTKLRFVPFAPEQRRHTRETRPYIFEDDLFGFLWKCFRPETPRPLCAVRYNFELWGSHFEGIVQFFKDPDRSERGTISDLYQSMNRQRRRP